MDNIKYNILGDKSHAITFTIDKSLKDKVLNKDINDYKITFIDDAVKEINNQSANMIIDYNYEIISKTQIDIVILFKHIFKSLGAGQKYIKISCMIDHDGNIISINTNNDLKLKLSIPTDAQPLGLNNATISFQDKEGDKDTNITIKFISVSDISGDKSFEALIMLIKECILDIKSTIQNNKAV